MRDETHFGTSSLDFVVSQYLESKVWPEALGVFRPVEEEPKEHRPTESGLEVGKHYITSAEVMRAASLSV